MLKFIENWNKATTFRKVTTVLAGIFSVIAIILSILSIANVLQIELTNSIVLPLVGLIMLLNGLGTYKQYKYFSLFYIIFSAFILFFSISILFL